MAKYYLIEKYTDIENKLVTELEIYFNTTIAFGSIFPRFGSLRISETHPFAIANIALIAGKKVPGGLFPSITVSIVDEAASAPVLNKEKEIIELDQEWLTEQAGNPLALPAHITALETALTDNGKLFGIQTTDRSTSRIVFAIWSENREVRSLLYDQLKAFIYLRNDIFLDFDFENWTLSGTPSGLYNLDFGRVLYGAEVAMAGERQVTYVMSDTTWSSVATVDMYIANIGASE